MGGVKTGAPISQSTGKQNTTEQNKNNIDNNHPNHNKHHWLKVLQPAKIAIVQFDGRPLWEELHTGPNTRTIRPTVWNTAAIWNWLYSKKHGHEYIYYHWPNNMTKACRSSKNNDELAEAWCKVKVFLQVQEDLPHIDYFLFMDTDAVVDYKFRDESLLNVLHNMTTEWLPNWDIDEKPFVLNKEGPSYWCSMISDRKFSHCLNTGTVFWKRSYKSTEVLERWWMSADDPYDDDDDDANPLGIKFRTDTPWEQVQAQSLLRNPAVNRSIQIASHPETVMQLEGPCLSDCWLPPIFEQLGCFILHFCMNKTDLVEVYGNHLKALVKDENIDVRGNSSCYPRAILSMDSTMRQRGYQHVQTTFDKAPCRFEWIVERALSGFIIKDG